jgi:hypothetical protein
MPIARSSCQIEPRPPRHQCQCALLADVAQIVSQLLLSGLARRSGNDGHHCEDQDLCRVAATGGSAVANIGNDIADDFLRGAIDENAFRMLCGELPAAGRGAGLVQYRRALRRRFAEVDGVELKIGTVMGYAVDPVGVGKLPPSPIPQYCSILPVRAAPLRRRFSFSA